MTLIGAIIALGCLITGHKPKMFHHNVYFTFGEGGWGFNCGAFFFLSKDAEIIAMKQHEAGHGIQNIIFGVFMPFIVALPSVIRFWWREYLVKSGKNRYSELPSYDSMWFEGWATALGEKYFPNM